MFRRRRKQKDFEAEIEAHLALEANDFKARGLTEEQARTPRGARLATPL